MMKAHCTHNWMMFAVSVFFAASLKLAAQPASEQPAPSPVSQEQLNAIGNAVTGGQTFAAVVLQGTVLLNVNPAPITENIHIIVKADGATEIREQGSAGERIEQYAAPGSAGTCFASSHDQTMVQLNDNNCRTSASLILPTLAFTWATTLAQLSAEGSQITIQGTPFFKLRLAITKSPVLSSEILKSPNDPVTGIAASKLWANRTILLNPVSNLPVEMDFIERYGKHLNAHSSVRMLYSDYRSVQGMAIPFEIKRIMDANTVEDIHIESVAIQ